MYEPLLSFMPIMYSDARKDQYAGRIRMNKSLATNLAAVLLIGLGYIVPFAGFHVRTVGFFALSGAVTNWLAVHMLFEKVPLLYGSGVVPNHFEDFKSGIRNLIMDQFFTLENMQKFLADTSEEASLNIDAHAIADGIDYDRAFTAVTSMILESSFGGMLNMFGGPAVLQGFKEPFKARFHGIIVEEISQGEVARLLQESVNGGNDDIAASVKGKVDTIVASRLEELTPSMVKEIVQQMIAKHLGWLVVWGGVFGGLIGLVMSFVQRV
jgi:uncharacterized membrane protein YheB (UPF0754 family)